MLSIWFGFFEGGNDAPDALVHPIDLRRVHLHAALLPILVRGLLPRRLGRVTVGDRPRRIDDSLGTHPLQALLPQPVPAGREPAPVTLDVLRMGMERPMRRCVGGVEEKRGVGSAIAVFADVVGGLVADRVGEEEILGQARHVDGVVVLGQRSRLPVVGRAPENPEVAVEAALAGPTMLGAVGRDLPADVPFAAHVGGVSRRPERLGDGHALVVEAAPVAVLVEIRRHPSDADLVGVEAGEDRRPGGAAPGGVVELGEADAVGGQTVETRGLDLAAVAADVGEPHVVVHDEQDVGSVGGHAFLL